MINPNELVRRPVRERDLLPIATDEQVIQDFQERIESICREVKSPIRAPHMRHTADLLHISGGEEYSLVYSRSRFGQRRDQLRVERDRGQELLFKVMDAYGFDQEKSKPHLRYNPYDLEGKMFREDITVRPDGTTREVLLCPSQTVKGLVFERVRDFVTDTGQTTDAWWNVVDEGPLLNIKNIFRRMPKPQIYP